jgi:putative Ca2+/H+ antiporter (TMEM165/GDT1 family)
MSAGIGGFLSGLITMCFAAIGLSFVRFWRLSRDPLFIAFALAFWLLAVNQTLVGLLIVPREEQSWLYLLRVVAFLVIAIAILWKNRRRGSSM